MIYAKFEGRSRLEKLYIRCSCERYRAYFLRLQMMLYLRLGADRFLSMGAYGWGARRPSSIRNTVS